MMVGNVIVLLEVVCEALYIFTIMVLALTSNAYRRYARRYIRLRI